MLCPSLESEETRILSFSDNWPHRVDNLSPERMAKAGFLYRGSDDRAFCFYCGLSIYQWADTDIPEIEHAKYWSACAYLERTFGLVSLTNTVTSAFQKRSFCRERDSGLLPLKKQ